jgi:nucleoside-diphosphate-sugar epimerase
MMTHHNPGPVKPSRVVVLGAGGFIAGAVSAQLRTQEIPVLALGRPGLDLLSPDAALRLAAQLRPQDTLFFASAKAPVRDLAMLQDNLTMARAVCTALKQIPVAHVIYLSSDAVYRDSADPLTELSCAEPGSLHGVMHLTREIALRSDYAGPLAILRSTLVYGLDDPHNGYGPNRFRRLAAEGKEITLFGEGEERRDHVDVEDVAELVTRIMLHQSEGVINAASGDVASFRELAELAASAFEPKVAVKGSPRSGPMPHNGYRPFDNSAIAQAFPSFCFRSWREGLTRIHDRIKDDKK